MDLAASIQHATDDVWMAPAAVLVLVAALALAAYWLHGRGPRGY